MTRFVICSKVSLKPAALCLSHPCSGVSLHQTTQIPWLLLTVLRSRFRGSSSLLRCLGSCAKLGWPGSRLVFPQGPKMSCILRILSNFCLLGSLSCPVILPTTVPTPLLLPLYVLRRLSHRTNGTLMLFVSSFQFFGQQEHFFLSLCPFSAVSKHRPFLVFNQVSISHNTLISFHLLCGFAWVHCS